MARQRILMIYVEPTTYILQLIRELMAHDGCHVDVLFIAQNHSQGWNLSLEGIPHQMLPAGRMEAFRAMRRKLREGRYDVLHLAGWGHFHLVLAMLAGASAGVPVFMESDTPLPHRPSGWKRIVKKVLYPGLFRIPARFLPGGTRQADYLRHYAVGDDRIRIAYMTVDTSAISAYVDSAHGSQRGALRALHDLDGTTVFLYFGRMEPHKGLRELIDAFARLDTGRRACRLLLAGDGSLRDEVTQAGLRDPRIRYLGRLSGTDLLDAYCIADVFVLPSLFEPWGLVVNEAMAAGLPVICSDRVGCIDDLVLAGETGCIVPAESADDLAAAMQRFLDDPERQLAMGRRAREHIAPWTIARSAEVMRLAWTEVTT